MNTQSKKEIFITNSFEETQKIGEEFAKKLIGGGVVALHGDLGGGKTTFTQGIARGLGIKNRIISPTFIVLRTYKLKTENLKQKTTLKNSKLFYHIDLYRIETKNDIEGLGIDEILKNKDNIVVIEWAERLGNLLPKQRIDVYFEYINENKRKITTKNF